MAEGKRKRYGLLTMNFFSTYNCSERFLKYIKNGMVSNPENVFYIVTATSCFDLIFYQRRHTAKIDRLSEDR